MGGLQNSLIVRSKSIEGDAVLFLKNNDVNFAKDVNSFLLGKGIIGTLEFEIELLLKNRNYISPVLIHGIEIESAPEFLKSKDFSGLIIGSEFAAKIQSDFFTQVMLISPSHVNSLLGDIPRQVTTVVKDIVYTNVPEVDMFHAWTRLSLLQNLIRENSINRIRVHTNKTLDFDEIKADLHAKFGNDVELKTWADTHSALVWSLNLETKVMLFLFIAMTFLVAIAVTSGFMIFFGKIKLDLISFWILGSPLPRLKSMVRVFLHIVAVLTCSAGIITAYLALILLRTYGGEIMPDVFVERSVPVLVTYKGIFVSFIVPYLISVVFSSLSLSNFEHSEDTFLSEIRSVG